MYKNYMNFYSKKRSSRRFFSQILKNEFFLIERQCIWGHLRGNTFFKNSEKIVPNSSSYKWALFDGRSIKKTSYLRIWEKNRLELRFFL